MNNSTETPSSKDWETDLLDWVSACQSAYHIDNTPGHRFGALGSNLEENRAEIINFVNDLIETHAAKAVEADRKARGGPAGSGWIDPNDKSQKQSLPHPSERILFKHDGHVYTGYRTGDSFKSEYPLGQRFPASDCLWMRPESIDALQSSKPLAISP